MKKLYFFISLFLFSILGHSQIVNIPDPDFKAVLLSYDTNSDNEIQVSEALAVTSLQLFYNPTYHIQSLAGLEAFTNLTSLGLRDMDELTTIDLSALTALQNVSIYMVPLTSLDVSMLANLQNLYIGYTNLTALSVSGLPNLTRLEVEWNNLLNNLTLSDLPALEDVEVTYNLLLTSLSFTTTPQIKDLDFNGSSNLTTVDLSGLSQLQSLNASSTGLLSLDVSGLSNLQILQCFQCYNLSSLITIGANAIKRLYCNGTNLSSIDVSAMAGLEELTCGHRTDQPSQFVLTTLNVSGLTQLRTLHCEGNQISNLDVSSLSNLTSLVCSRNQLTSLNVAPLTNLTNLDCSSNQLSTLNLSTLTNLEYLNCGFNQLSVLDISQQTKLSYLSCGGNLLTEIDTSHIDISYLNSVSTHPSFYFDQSPNLEYINMKFGPIYFYGSFSNCSSLRFICIEEENRPRLLEIIADSNNTQEIVSNSYCSFSPGGQYNTLAGTITFDTNNTGCTVSTPHLPQIKITLDDGNQTGATFTNSNGNFTFFTQIGNFIITPEFENTYFAISPASATVNFATSGPSSQIQSFCVAPLGIHYDGEITIIPITTARPGFDASYKLIYKNLGNQTLSGNINLIFNDDLIDFVSANPAISSQTTNNLNWVYSNLLPFETREIDLTFNVNSPQELPAVNNGDLLNFKATIGINAEEETMENNISNLDQIVVGSFDPNDKTCLEGNTISPEMVGNYLHYLIRFQNSGTAAAENVVVKDIIDTNKFDISSLQLTSSSHPQVTKITGNKVEFQFQNINLPAEIDDEPGSHGYIAFKIKTKANLVIGDSVSNKADIYFDYNFPIETNTATATISLLGVNAFEDTSVTVVPNPVKNQLKINSKDQITSVQIFDLQGRILETLTANSLMVDIDLSQKSKGTYFVKVMTEKGSSTEKIIKD